MLSLGMVSKKNLMELSIKLAGCGSSTIRFSIKRNIYGLKMLYFDCSHPTTHPRDFLGGDTKRVEGGLIKVKKQIDFNIHFM